MKGRIAPGLGAVLLVAVGAKATRAVRESWASSDVITERLGAITPALQQEGRRWWSLDVQGMDWLGGLGLLVVVLLMIAYSRAGRQTERIGEEHGSAAWGGGRDIAPYAGRRGEPRLRFTATETLSLDTRTTRRNLNVLAVGGAGSRKTRSFVLPNLLSGNGVSFAATDPKGELYREAAEPLRAAGYDVRALNLVDLRSSSGFNPLAYIDRDQPEVGIAQLAATIVSNTESKGVDGKDAFWDRAERALLTSLTAYAYFMGEAARIAALADEARSPGSVPPKGLRPASLIDVVELVKKLEASEDNEKHTSEVDEMMEVVRDLLDNWSDLPDMRPEESDHIRDGLHFAAGQYRIFQQGAGETKKGVIISLGVRLAVLDVPDVRRLLSHDELAIEQLGLTPGVLFCILPDTHQTFRFISALFWHSMFSVNVYVADHSPEGQLEVPIQCYLDEFANIGRIPDFPQVISTIRSRGISVAVILQTLGQLKALYRDEWEVIAGNCDSFLFLGGNDATTLDWLSKRLGRSTIKVEDTSQSRGRNGSSSRSLKKTHRDLMTPDELGRMNEEECIYLLRGVKPFKSRKVPIYVG